MLSVMSALTWSWYCCLKICFDVEFAKIDVFFYRKSAERVARIIRLVKPFKITQSLDDDDDDESEERFRHGKAEDNEHDDDLDATVGGDRNLSRKGSFNHQKF